MNKESYFQVHVGQRSDFLKILSKASYLNCGPLRSFFNERLKAGQSCFVIDFQDCKSIDSTFLGILVGLALKIKKSDHSGSLTLLNLRGRNLETVKNLGIHKIAVVSSEVCTDSSHLEALISKRINGVASSKIIYQAHKSLMNLNEKNLKSFSDVVSYLEQNQLGSEKPL